LRTLVVYDSVYGNTARIGVAIGREFTGDVKEGPLKEGELEPVAAWAWDLPNTSTQPG
jgi:hypothetical protein